MRPDEQGLVGFLPDNKRERDLIVIVSRREMGFFIFIAIKINFKITLHNYFIQTTKIILNRKLSETEKCGLVRFKESMKPKYLVRFDFHLQN